MTETFDVRLAEALVAFLRAAEANEAATDEDVWLQTPDYTITIGDLRAVVRLAARGLA